MNLQTVEDHCLDMASLQEVSRECLDIQLLDTLAPADNDLAQSAQVLSRQDYLQAILSNLQRMSRTVGKGICDNSISADKGNLSVKNGSDLKLKASGNIADCVDLLYSRKDRCFSTQAELNSFVEDLIGRLNNGLTDKIYRTHDTSSKGYGIDPCLIEDEMQSFLRFYNKNLRKITKRSTSLSDIIEFAAMTSKILDKDIHPLSDGCGRLSMLLSSYVFMVAKQQLPRYEGRERYYEEMNKVNTSASDYSMYDPTVETAKGFINLFKKMFQSSYPLSLDRLLNDINTEVYLGDDEFVGLQNVSQLFRDTSGRFRIIEDLDRNLGLVITLPLQSGKHMNIVLSQDARKEDALETLLSDCMREIEVADQGVNDYRLIHNDSLQEPLVTAKISIESELEEETRVYLPPGMVSTIQDDSSERIKLMSTGDEIKINCYITDRYDSDGRLRVRCKNGLYRLGIKIPLFYRDSDVSKSCLRLELKSDGSDGQNMFRVISDAISTHEDVQYKRKKGGRMQIPIGEDYQCFWVNINPANRSWIEFDGNPEQISYMKECIEGRLGFPLSHVKSDINIQNTTQ